MTTPAEMLESAATPDWTLCDRGDYADFDGDSRVILGDGMSVRIGVIQTDGRPEFEANARLAVAAPELLKALQEIADMDWRAEGSWKSVALKAIALATGASQ